METEESQISSRNPWPWAIVGTLVLFLAGTVSLVVLACSQKVDLISRNYYEQELKFQAQIERQDHARKLPDAAVTYDAAARRILISLPKEHANRTVSGWIQLYRPSAAGLDREIALNVDARGSQALDAAALQPGLWKVRVFWKADNKEYFIDQKVVLGTDNPLAPAVVGTSAIP